MKKIIIGKRSKKRVNSYSWSADIISICQECHLSDRKSFSLTFGKSQLRIKGNQQ